MGGPPFVPEGGTTATPPDTLLPQLLPHGSLAPGCHPHPRLVPRPFRQPWERLTASQ